MFAARIRNVVAGTAILLASGAVAAVATGGERNSSSGPPALRLVVDLEGQQLHVFENGKKTRTYAVSTGKKGHRTPAGTYRIKRVVWNPWWHPPDEKWARGKKVTPPGRDNPMGRVKLDFGNMLYIHGTQEVDRLGAPASHGCVRMRNKDVIALARLIHKYTTPSVKSNEIEALVQNSSKTRSIWLTRGVELVATTNYAARFGKVDKTAGSASRVKFVNGERLLGRPVAAGGD